jgi:hypothetical protein
MKNTPIIENIVLYYQSCGVKVSKNKVERMSGVGVWPVNASKGMRLVPVGPSYIRERGINTNLSTSGTPLSFITISHHFT